MIYMIYIYIYIIYIIKDLGSYFQIGIIYCMMGKSLVAILDLSKSNFMRNISGIVDLFLSKD